MWKRVSTVLIAVSIVFALGILVWRVTYPDNSDPKSLRYTLWKHNLYKMDLDVAAELMVGDRERDRIVIGQTKDELREKFGYLLSLDDASPYLRTCYQSSPWHHRDVMFIRRSPWMVVFGKDRAANLVLIKGC